MCRSDWECDCHLRPQECPTCEGTGRDPDEENGVCRTCEPYEPDFDGPDFDPHAADRMADARWDR